MSKVAQMGGIMQRGSKTCRNPTGFELGFSVFDQGVVARGFRHCLAPRR